jgi:type VI secretion system protein ImpM
VKPLDHAPGLFGKLPCAGDFLSHNLPAALLARLDRWLCKMMQQGIQTHGQAWVRAYFNMPMYGFTLCMSRDGQASGSTMVGIWMPSVDRVGRAFPFLLLDLADMPHTCGKPTALLNDWFLKASSLCASALSEEWPLANLVSELSHLPRLRCDGTRGLTPPNGAEVPSQGNWYRIEPGHAAIWAMRSNGLPENKEFSALLGLGSDS